MNSQSVIKALAKIDRLYVRLTLDVKRIVQALDAEEQSLVVKVARGLGTLDRARKATKIRRPRPVTALASKSVRKSVQRVVRRSRKKVRRTAAEVEALIVQSTTEQPRTAADLRGILGYTSNSGIYGLVARLVTKGLLVRGKNGDGEFSYAAVPTFTELPSRGKTNGADTSHVEIHSQPGV